MARPRPLSGFPEWTPQQRVVEQALLDRLRRTFELHGFSSVETRSVEPLTTLLAEGETGKEVYALRRASADPDEGQGELGLHVDLLDTGLAELVDLVEEVHRVAPGLLVADLRIARGLDYYAGAVYETTLA